MQSSRAGRGGDESTGNGGANIWQNHIARSSPKLATAMEAAMAGAAEVGRVSRRIIQRIWDSEPVNNRSANEPTWCLGCAYTQDPNSKGPRTANSAATPPYEAAHTHAISISPPKPASATRAIVPGSPPPPPPADSAGSSADSSHSLADVEPGQDGGWPPAFLDDFESRIWMTYRTGFEPIPKSNDPKAASALSLTMRLKTSFADQTGFSSDTGWGCMIRSGQSLLANAMSIHRLGRDWRRNRSPDAERSIISQFADDPRAPYSIHNFVRHGAVACGKYPGEWFGPSSTARCIEALANQHQYEFRVYATDLPEVYEANFMSTANPDGKGFRPTLILVGTRLGIDKINHVYEEALVATLQIPQSVGIAGGRPSSSHYFVGTQGKWLFYLDPHHPRPALPFYENPLDYTTADLDSCHTRRLRHLHVSDMDPSMLIGFLIRDEDDWDSWKIAVKHVQGKAIVTIVSDDPGSGVSTGRAEAIDEVEALSDDEESLGQ